MEGRLAINCLTSNPIFLIFSNIMTNMIKESAKEILARNVLALRNHSGWSQTELAKKARVSQRTVSNIESPQRDPNYSPNIDSVDRIAGVFGLTLYHLAMPLPLDALLNRQIEKIVEHFGEANEKDRENIERIAEMAVKYRLSAA